MNDKTKPRDCWSLLVGKARRAVEEVEAQLAQARNREAQLQASQQRVAALMADYRRREAEGQQRGQLMADSLNQRQFIAQLQQLLDQSMRACSQARAQTEAMLPVLAAAQQELRKAEKLESQFRAAAQLRKARAEQKSQDELSVQRWHWRGA